MIQRAALPICVLAIATGMAFSVQSYLQSRQAQPAAVVEAASRLRESAVIETGVAHQVARHEGLDPTDRLATRAESREIWALLGGGKRKARRRVEPSALPCSIEDEGTHATGG